MESKQVRKKFLEFFETRQHRIVPSAPMVIKDDPTLMFTNAGMNQFKDIFLGHREAEHLRVANTQKCLRVSGKHNDLEEVGHDTYHHTMFEMLGNWSFGDYFKAEAIEWAWELLTGVLGIDPERLYVTVYGGDKEDGLGPDDEAREEWKKWIPENRILYGSKKDNFWEMGDTGPCGPCSEIHIDLRDDEPRSATPGQELVNKDHPEVIEIWNLVFIQYNRSSDGSLHLLPKKHVDTGMGFERLCMVLQGKKSNYDTDIFQPLIRKTSELSGIPYGKDEKSDVALRVIADHVRAVTFAIADGQLPSNVKAGYVIRRILRRAVRYGFTFLGLEEPFLFELVPVLVETMGDVFPEIDKQQQLIARVIREEEQSFLRTLSQGIRMFENYCTKNPGLQVVDGKFVFELFDTYGFPVDLTRLMAREKGLEVDLEGFQRHLEEQKARSRKAAEKESGDWVVLDDGVKEVRFVGYELLRCEARIIRYRQVKEKKKTFYQLVLDQTPFYAESGGQVGDRGYLLSDGKKIAVTDTRKENDLIVHFCSELPEEPGQPVEAVVDEQNRLLTANNHSATHLLHAALRKVLGTHVEQKGSLVDSAHLRFDFAHFSKMTPEEIRKVEQLVNEKIRENIALDEARDVPIEEAQKRGAMALFGEKYGDRVRVITFDPQYSVELCGGTHVRATGQIGYFKIVSEGAIAAGIRRVEALTGAAAEQWVDSRLDTLESIRQLLNNPKDPVTGVKQLIEQQEETLSKLKRLQTEQTRRLAKELSVKAETVNGVSFVTYRTEMDMQQVKDLAWAVHNDLPGSVILIGSQWEGKANLTLMIDSALVEEHNLHAGNIIRELAKNIRGGGGGQPHFATAGGKEPSGFDKAFEQLRQILAAI
ncbi:MAG: alanine--tRNA ligase [Bacteroidales bacterium]